MELEIAFNCNHIGRLLIKIHSGKHNKFNKALFYTGDLREIVKKCVNKDENKRPNTLH